MLKSESIESTTMRTRSCHSALAGTLLHLIGAVLWFATWMLLVSMALVRPLFAESVEGCSWNEPVPSWALDRTLSEIDLAGPVGAEVIPFLHEAGVPISFISMADDEPEVRIRHTGTISIRELLEDVLAQAPDYRLEIVSGKLVIYPFEGFDALVDLGNLHETTRADAWITVFRGLRSKTRELREIRTVLRGPFYGLWDDLISVGGVRSAIEHLVSPLCQCR